MELIAWLDGSGATVAACGGKGAGLAALIRGGLPVPDGFVVTAAAHDSFIMANSLPDLPAQLANPAACDAQGAHDDGWASARRRLAAAVLPPPVAAAIDRAYRRLSVAGGAVAVRSSAINEDGAIASAAGLYPTRLNVHGSANVLAAVHECYVALWEAPAVRYRQRAGQERVDERMAVVVQRFVAAEVAGVAFTADPVSGGRDRVVINATWGLGEPLVAGRITPDQYVIAKGSGAVLSRSIGAKHVEVHPRPIEDGLETLAAAPARAAAATLTDDRLHELTRLCLVVERLFGRAMDIEWAYAAGRPLLLQARPITGLP